MKHKDSENQRGLIIKVQRYCVQDGPGIRSTIFFKGCPLRCLWCSSPETHNNYPEIIFFEEKCIESCDQCIAACQKGAIHKDGVKTIIDRGVCNICGKCSQVCPSGALSLVGYSVGIQNLLEEIAKDKTFYEVSGGGVTFSGGEPLFQPKFALEFAKKCKENGFSVAIDTSGFCNSKTLQSILQYIDLVLFDIKFIHPIKHQKYTSVRNDIILENAKLVSNQGIPLIVRFPLIPGINDLDDELMRLAHFVKELRSVQRLDILPFHELGIKKYQLLDREYKFKPSKIIDKKYIEQKRDFLEKFGVKVNICS